jgi:ubiquitin-protein ligase
MPLATAIKQLQRDLEQLRKEPIIGANAAPIGDDLMKWRGMVLGVEDTPYAGVPICFDLEFNEDYPNSAPSAFFLYDVKYTGGASYSQNGRLVVCLNIFGNFAHVHTEWKDEVASGWSPSYSVSTILVTMQGLMVSGMLSTNPKDIETTRQSAKNFKCAKTGHDGLDPSTWYPKVLHSQEELEEYYKKNNLQNPNVGRKYDPLRDHYICYVKKSSLADAKGPTDLLGYGIHLENPRIGMLSSACEYLSLGAFKDGTRQSSTKKAFEHWLPILPRSSDWASTKGQFEASIKEIGKVINFANKPMHEVVIKVCSSIMNTLVVEIMNNKNNLTANDKFVDGYFSLYRLMVQYASDDNKLIEYADRELNQFITKPEKRTKETVSNLGELLILLTVSKKFTWKDISSVFLAETDARNVFWYAVGNYNNPPKHPELLNITDASANAQRTKKVFAASEVSRSLIMYQVKFSQVAKTLSAEIMDSNCGLAPANLRTEMKETYKGISSVTDWDGYFKFLQVPPVTDTARCDQLVNAVKLSEKNGYHKSGAASTPRNNNRSHNRY